MTEDNGLLNNVLAQLKTSSKDASIFLKTGIQLRGRILDFDSLAILIEHRGMSQLIFMQAVSAVACDTFLPQ